MKKAIFLVGGPGSGKDIVLREVLCSYEIKELKLEQVKPEYLTQNQPLVISTNAYNLEGIVVSKKLLENFGFETSMIFVDVSDNTSKQRLSSRNVSEEIRRKRLEETKQNIPKFRDIFPFFVMFENNSTTKSSGITDLTIFCESFINLENILVDKKTNNKKVLNRSIKDKLLKKSFPVDLLTKVKSDRIGDEYSIRNSGMGFPSTVGPFYNESFSEYEPELPAFASDSRSMPDQQKYEEQPKTKALKSIKKLAKSSWERGKSNVQV